VGSAVKAKAAEVILKTAAKGQTINQGPKNYIRLKVKKATVRFCADQSARSAQDNIQLTS
jgi:hypothetical protein